MIFYEKTLEISTVILRACLVKNLIKFDKYCKVDKCSGKILFFLSKYCKLYKSFGRKVEIHQQYLRCGAKTAQILKNDRKTYHFYQNWTVLEYDEVF